MMYIECLNEHCEEASASQTVEPRTVLYIHMSTYLSTASESMLHINIANNVLCTPQQHIQSSETE